MNRPISHILYVEDEPYIQAIARMSLEELGGFVLETADSGPQGLEKARAMKPDLILLDMMMPGMDGVTTLAKLRADSATASIPVVFLTAKVQAQEVAGYRKLGAADVIAKPFDPVTLPDELRAIWNRVQAEPV